MTTFLQMLGLVIGILAIVGAWNVVTRKMWRIPEWKRRCERYERTGYYD